MLDEQQDIKILCGIIEPEPPTDEEDETQYEVGYKYSEQYNLSQIDTYFGKSEFKENFLVNINDIRQQRLYDQASLCQKLLKKIYATYDFEFTPYPLLITQRHLDRVYDLVAFLHYDNIEFISNVWKAFGIDNIIRLNIESFFIQKRDRIKKLTEHITNNSFMYKRSTLINEFLNSCTLYGVLYMVISISYRSKIEISANLMKGK